MRAPSSSRRTSSRPQTAVTKPKTTHTQEPEKVLKRFTIWHDAEGHARKTEDVYEKTLRPFFVFLKNEYQIEDLTQFQVDHVRSWLVWLRNTPGQHGTPRSSKTVESYCRQVLVTCSPRWSPGDMRKSAWKNRRGAHA